MVAEMLCWSEKPGKPPDSKQALVCQIVHDNLNDNNWKSKHLSNKFVKWQYQDSNAVLWSPMASVFDVSWSPRSKLLGSRLLWWERQGARWGSLLLPKLCYHWYVYILSLLEKAKLVQGLTASFHRPCLFQAVQTGGAPGAGPPWCDLDDHQMLIMQFLLIATNLNSQQD